MTSNLTPARRHGLDVVGRYGHARVGVGTHDFAEGDPIITPAAEGWLIAQGYIERTGDKQVELTEAGLAAFHQLPPPEGEPDPGDEPPESAIDRLAATLADETPPSDANGAAVPGQPGLTIVPIGPVPAYDGQAVAGLDTSFAGNVGTIRHLRIGERIITISLLEAAADGHKNTARDGIRATQKLKKIECYEIGGTAAESLLNNVREAWHQISTPEALPFKQAGDAALVKELGLDGHQGAVVVVFANGARAVHPDDFPKGMSRPHIAERLEVPGSSDEHVVVELIDHATGKVLAEFTGDDEDDVADPVDAGDEEG